MITEDTFLKIFNKAERYIEERHGIPVRIGDVAHPFTGDLDGAEIQVDYAENAENALFILVHLFGHTVQWNLSDAARELEFDQWMADFSACDFAYLKHFYQTGERRPFREFWKDGQPLLPALPIPSFTPEKWLSRWKGVVV